VFRLGRSHATRSEQVVPLATRHPTKVRFRGENGHIFHTFSQELRRHVPHRIAGCIWSLKSQRLRISSISFIIEHTCWYKCGSVGKRCGLPPYPCLRSQGGSF
jgi:hypothetical protein